MPEVVVEKPVKKRATRKVVKKAVKKVITEKEIKKRVLWVTTRQINNGRYVFGIQRETGGAIRRHFAFSLRGWNANCGAAELCYPVVLNYDDKNFPKSADSAAQYLLKHKKLIVLSKARMDRFCLSMTNQDFLWKYFGFKRFANPRGNHGRYVMEYYYLTEDSYNASRNKK